MHTAMTKIFPVCLLPHFQAEVTPSREALAVGSPGNGKSDEDEQGQNRAHDYGG